MKTINLFASLSLAASLTSFGCSSEPITVSDSGLDANFVDTSVRDSGTDALVDSGTLDSTASDGGVDGGVADAGSDTAVEDASIVEMGQFLLSSLVLPTNSDVSNRTVAGFNLDNTVSTGPDTNNCLNRVDREGPNGTGIDNQLGPIIGSLANGQLQSAINAASFGLTFEVVGSGNARTLTVRSLPNSFAGPLTLEGGKPAPGQSIPRGTVVAENIALTMDSSNAANAELASLPISIPISSSQTLLLNLTQVRLRATLTTTGISSANIGGILTREELAAALNAAGYGFFLGIVDDAADFAQSPSDPNTCNSISMGFAFTGVPATLTN